MSQRFGNRNRFATNLIGPYACDEVDDAQVTCYLEIADTRLVVDIPADVLKDYRLSNGHVTLRIPGERVIPIKTAKALTDREQRLASGWSSEMADFDRF